MFVGVMCVVICNPGLILNSSRASFALGLGLWLAGCHAGSVMDDIMLLFMLGQSGSGVNPERLFLVAPRESNKAGLVERPQQVRHESGPS